MRRRRLLAPVLAAVLLLSGCTSTGLQTQAPPDRRGGGVDEWTHPTGAPVDFSGPTVDGTTFRSAAHRGEVVVVNFWYQDCPPCNLEAPVLEALAKKYAKDRVQFVGVNTADGKDDADGFERKYALTYPSILDQANDGAAQTAFQATVPPAAIPSTIVLDRRGRVTARLISAVDPSRRSTLDALIGAALDRKDA